MDDVRIALIGVGAMGKKYAEMICAGLVPQLRLTAVVCRSQQAQQWAAGLAGSPHIFESTDALYANPNEYDAVLIVTPHKTHEQMALTAFALGKDVLCDKPAAASIKQAQTMTAAARQAGRVYGMVFHQRLYPKYLKIHELIESGELGQLRRVLLVNSRYFRTSSYHDSSSWRSRWNGGGGAALINQGQHILDIWQWLFGMPQRLTATIPFGKYNDFIVDDEATITMEYPDKMTATFILTTGEAIWEERLEIIGTKGRILMEDDTVKLWKYSEDSDLYVRTAQTTSRENLQFTEQQFVFEKAAEPYPQMLENFAQAVLAHDSSLLIAPGADAEKPLMLANAAYYSALQSSRVQLPLDADKYEQALEERCRAERECG